MLTTYINNVPYSKFILIEDNVEQQGKNILKYIINTHIKSANCTIHYFGFERNIGSVKGWLSRPNVVFHDFANDPRGWLAANNEQDFLTAATQTNEAMCVIVIDSLADAIFQYGISTVYKILQQALITSTGLLRIATILHQDTLENPLQTCQYFEHLATLSLILEGGLNKGNPRISYTYRKTNGKVIKQVEEYSFENGHLKTQQIKKMTPKTLVQEHLSHVLPENLTTFKISLDDKEKESRDKLILPYLPREDGAPGDSEVEGNIFYKFDHTDDWDEEDPDDDLDL